MTRAIRKIWDASSLLLSATLALLSASTAQAAAPLFAPNGLISQTPLPPPPLPPPPAVAPSPSPPPVSYAVPAPGSATQSPPPPVIVHEPASAAGEATTTVPVPRIVVIPTPAAGANTPPAASEPQAPRVVTVPQAGSGANAAAGAPRAYDYLCAEYAPSTLTDMLNQAGERGWELTSIGRVDKQDLMCFRRPR
jgi:hypothetical protein